MDADLQRELLAGDRVDERLEHRREARRPQATQTLYQPTKQRILGGHRHERRDIDVESEQEG